MTKPYDSPDAEREDVAMKFAYSLQDNGNVLGRAGRSAEALEVWTETRGVAEAVTRRHPDNVQAQEIVASVSHKLGAAYRALGRSADAARALAQARELAEAILRDRRQDPVWQALTAEVCVDVGECEAATGRADAARAAFARAAELARSARAAAPNDRVVAGVQGRAAARSAAAGP
jgi:tetratricopeptide (TPR) repeat protein